MMTNEARVAAVKERVRAREQQKHLRRIAGVMVTAAFITGAALCRWKGERKISGEHEEERR